MSTLDKLQNEFEDGIKQFAEWVKDKTEDEIQYEMRRRIKAFWSKKPWYLQILRPFIMKEAYKVWNGVTK